MTQQTHKHAQWGAWLGTDKSDRRRIGILTALVEKTETGFFYRGDEKIVTPYGRKADPYRCEATQDGYDVSRLADEEDGPTIHLDDEAEKAAFLAYLGTL